MTDERPADESEVTPNPVTPSPDQPVASQPTSPAAWAPPVVPPQAHPTYPAHSPAGYGPPPGSYSPPPPYHPGQPAPYGAAVGPLPGLWSAQAITGFVLSTVALVFAFPFGIAAIPGVILGHISLVNTRKRGQRGRGLAIAAIIEGYVAILLGLLFLGLIIWSIIYSTQHCGTSGYDSCSYSYDDRYQTT